MGREHALYVGDQIIGYSDLEDRDDGMGVASGAFRPTSLYSSVRPIFHRFAAALGNQPPRQQDQEEIDAYYRERDALPLRLVDKTGRTVVTSFIHIEDFAEEAGVTDPSTIRLVVQIADRTVFRE